MGRLENAMVAFALVALGCSSEALQTTDEDVAAESSAPLFEDHYSDTGRIVVYEEDGGLHVQVSGRIGKDDHDAIGALFGSGNLEHLYLELHPEEQSAPEALKRIDVRIAAEMEREAQRLSADPVALEDTAASLLTNKSQASFLAATCKQFSSSTDVYKPTVCAYGQSTQQVCQEFCKTCPENWRQRPGDRAFTWNDTPFSAQVSQIALTHRDPYVTSLVGDIRTQAPFTWSWHTWYNRPALSNGNVCLAIDRLQLGPLGITHHAHSVVVR